MNIVETYLSRREEPVEQYDILDALEAWMDGYSKDDAWRDTPNPLEARIIELAKDHPPIYQGMLYRGTGIEDDAALALQRGETVTIRGTKRLLASWSKDEDTAQYFCDDAADGCNASAVVMKLDSSRLKMVVDLNVLYDARPHTGHEAEVLCLNEPLVISPQDISELWIYDETKGQSVQVDLH